MTQADVPALTHFWSQPLNQEPEILSSLGRLLQGYLHIAEEAFLLRSPVSQELNKFFNYFIYESLE